MAELHLWITGAGRAACAAAAGAYCPDVAVDCHRGLRGPYTAAGSLLRVLVPRVQASHPGLAARHVVEILAMAPELESLLGPAPDTLTSLAPPAERTRWHSQYRTRRMAHGVIDFLRECATAGPAVGGRRAPGAPGPALTLAFGAVDHGDPTDAEFLAIALRRLDPAQVRLIVCSPGPDLTAELSDQLAARCCRQVIDEIEHPAQPPELAAAAFVDSDGTSDIPAERAAYLQLSQDQRATLHDQRAAELKSGDTTLQLGAIPYHLAAGHAPATEGKAAITAAISYCVGMAFYDAALELAGRLAVLAEADGDALERYQVAANQASCVALLGRAAEVEPMYHDLIARSAHPRTHAHLSYALAMLFTRLHDAERKDHRIARAYMSTALVIARLLEDPAERVFESAFMCNGKALVEMHLGDLEESLRLVSEGIELLETGLPPQVHRLHRSVLYHNRAQVLAALDRREEALAEFGRVIAADPNYPEYLFDRGNLLSRMGRTGPALADYEQAMTAGPPFAELYYNRGDLRAAAGDTEGARADFRYVLDLEPDYLDARVALASLSLDEGDAAEAAAEAQAGLQVTPDEARLHCALGLALLDLQELSAAARSFTRALELEAGMPEALANRAIAAYQAGRCDDAVADLTAALEVRAGDPDLLYNRGFALHAAGRPGQAIADYTLALQADGADRAAILYERGRCHAALGDLEQARTDLSAHLALGTSPYEQEIGELLGVAAQSGILRREPVQATS